MRGNKNMGIALVLSALGLMGTTSAMAQTSMQASANMAAACEISAPTVALGELTMTNGKAGVNQEFSIDVKCSKGTSYQVNNTQNYGYKPMIGVNTGPSYNLNYLLSYDKGGNWGLFGTKAEGNPHTLYGTGTGALVPHLMRVTVLSGSMPTPDSYSASTTIELTF